MNEAEVREAVEYFNPKDWGDGIGFHGGFGKHMPVLISLAKLWLGRKMVEKKSDVEVVPVHDKAKIEGWNAAIEVCRLASVVSEEEIKEIIRKWEENQSLVKINYDSLSHAIAENINGGVR
jgi:hypothetical protein